MAHDMRVVCTCTSVLKLQAEWIWHLEKDTSRIDGSQCTALVKRSFSLVLFNLCVRGVAVPIRCTRFTKQLDT